MTPVSVALILLAVDWLCNGGAGVVSGVAVTSYCRNGQQMALAGASGASGCFHYFNQRHGVLLTPNFPAAFDVPFSCSWIINATAYEADSFITLYLTQMYLTRGVLAVQYSSVKVNANGTHKRYGRKVLDELDMSRPRPFSVYRIRARYLEVNVRINDMENANLRIEDRLMDSYGFNITYEIQSNASKIRNDSCNAANCTFNGHCFASSDFSQFRCSCLPGFFGKYCQYGPDCNPFKGINFCKNGGSCGYRMGPSVVRCNCPPTYNGSLCEYRREFIPANECLSRFKLNCSHYCTLEDEGRVVCRCPADTHALNVSDTTNATCYPLVPMRIMGQLTINRVHDLATLSDANIVEEIEYQLNKTLNEYTAGLLAIGWIRLQWDLVQFQLISSASYAYNDSIWNNPVLTQLLTTTTSAASSSNWRNITDVDKKWPSAFNSCYNHLMQGMTLGPFDIADVEMSQVPALLIERIHLDHAENGQVREGFPFAVACKVNGSPRLTIDWFKDGTRVHVDAASLRHIEVQVLPENMRGYSTHYLRIKEATVSDRGEYECTAHDFGQNVSRSIFLDVVPPPILNVMPLNPTVQPNVSVTLTCRDENHLARRTMTTYTWLKNGAPLKSSCEETIENLAPVGSLLRISSIQLSSNYSCRGESMSTSSQQTTQIFVVDGGRACAPQPWMTISWQLTVCNATNYQFCPLGYVGVASRQCRCDRTWPWAEPDFSACVDRNVSDMQKLMKLVAMGYAVIDVSTIISKFSFYVQKKLSAWRMLSSSASSGSQSLLTGEGNGVIDLVTSISNYLWAKNHLFNAKFWNSSAVEFLRTLDLLLSMPPAYFSPQDDTPLLRIIQSHVTLLYKKVTEVMGELPPSNRFKLRNSNVLFGTLSSTGTQLATPRKFAAIQYDRIPPTLHIKGNFSWFEVASAPQFLFVKSGQRKNRSNSVDWTSKSDTSSINLTLEVSTSIQETQDSRYVCALLELERSGFDGMWDVNACGAAQRTQNVSFLCNCSAMGTVVLLHVHGFPQETKEPNWTWWIPIWISAWTGLLVSLLNLVLLSMKWYQKRTIWSWFQVQLAISLLPITFFYVSSPQNTENDVFWTLSLTTAIYHYLATILAMNLQLKLSFHAHCKSSNPKQRNSQFFIFSGVTSGITLGLSLVNVLLTSLSSSSFESWLKLGNHCVSSAFFYVASASLLLVITAFYLSSERKLNNFLRHKVTDTQQPYCDTSSRLIERVSYERCCVLLSAFSLLSIACVVGDHHWRSLPAHFLFTITNCLTVVVWTVTMLIFSQSRYRAYMGRSPAVSVVNQAAQSPHRPQTTDYFQPSDDEHSEMVAKVNLNVPLAVMKGSGKRSCRGAAAVSSPLLRHAGMGPDIRRAFSVDSADTLPEERSHPAPPAPQDTVGDKDGVEMGAQCHLLASHKTTAMDVGGDQWQREDLDSGLGPSGDGSQKLNGFDWFSDACRVFSRLRLSIPRRMRSGWNESMSSGTTELGVGDGTNSFTTAETEVPSPVADLTTTLPFPSHIRRSRTTRWMEDYGDGSQLVPEEAGDVVVCKPFRGFCLIRCSPERQPDGENEATSLVATKRLVTSARNCERCWHNPETPACELCCSADAADPQRHRSSGSSSSSFFIRAIVEKPPKTLSSIEGSSEYLTMDPAGSLAVGDYIKYQSYCNVQLKSNELQQIDVQSKFKFQSLSAPSSPKFNKCQRPSWRSIFRSTHSLASRRSSDDTT